MYIIRKKNRKYDEIVFVDPLRRFVLFVITLR